MDLARRILLIWLLATAVAHCEIETAITRARRNGNRKRNRDHCDEVLASLSDDEFKNQTGLSRTMFNYVLSLILPRLTKTQLQRRMAEISSGSPISSVMKLFIHQRIMKGSKKLDVEWMGASPRHAWDYIWFPVASTIDEVLDNVEFDVSNENWLKTTADQWAWQQQRKYGNAFYYGLIATGDGLIAKIRKLSSGLCAELQIPLTKFWCRKGYYGLNVQAFCDAWCRFLVFEMLFPASTHDVKAYREGNIFTQVVSKMDAALFFFFLDEAYKGVYFLQTFFHLLNS